MKKNLTEIKQECADFLIKNGFEEIPGKYKDCRVFRRKEYPVIHICRNEIVYSHDQQDWFHTFIGIYYLKIVLKYYGEVFENE